MAMNAFRPFFIAVLLPAIPAAMFARTPATAHATVQNWTARHSHPFGRALGRPTGRVLTAAANGTNLFHSVALSGGGFAVVADRDDALLAGATDFFAVPSSMRPVWRGKRKPCACAVPSSMRPVWRGELPFDKGAAR